MPPHGMFLLDKTKPRYFTCAGVMHAKVALFLIIIFTVLGEIIELCTFIFSGNIPTGFELVFEVIEYIVTFTLILSFVKERSIFLIPFIGQSLVVVVLLLLNTLVIFYCCFFPFSSVANDVFITTRLTFWKREQKLLLALAFMALFTTLVGWCLHVSFTCYSYFEDRLAEKKTREGRSPVDPGNNSRPPLVQPSFVNPNFSIEDDEDKIFEQKPTSPQQMV